MLWVTCLHLIASDGPELISCIYEKNHNHTESKTIESLVLEILSTFDFHSVGKEARILDLAAPNRH